jgi:heptosyltransferase-2
MQREFTMAPPQRVLFLTEGQVGDSLVLTPALRAVKQTFPSCFVAVLVVERYTPLKDDLPELSVLVAAPQQRARRVLGLNPHVDELLIVARNRLRALRGIERLRAELAIVRSIRRFRFDTVISTWPADRFSLWAFLSGAPRRIGQRNTNFHFLLTHTPEIEKADRGILEYYCDLARATGARMESLETELTISPSERQRAREFLLGHGIGDNQPFVVVLPGATADYKIFPPERFATIIDYVTIARNIPVVLCEGPLDNAIVEEIVRRVERAPIRFVGNASALIEASRLCISNDSGPRHIAVALRTPSLAFFRLAQKEWDVYQDGPTRVSLRTAGACSACPVHKCDDITPLGERYGTHCMRMISTDAALAALRDMLGRLGL